MPLRLGVIIFPGSNCDHDAYHAARHVFGLDTRFIWHKETDLADVDVVVVPGGFSYGDYLRAGAIARFSPIMKQVVRFAGQGGVVLGICNGFQVLCECGLLPGALLRNVSLRFVCRWVHLRVEHAAGPFTGALSAGQVIRLPIAHGEGNYFANKNMLRQLEDRGQVLLRYCNPDGADGGNPNGSVHDIAAVVNETRNVLGMMPHPERCTESLLGGADGGLIFKSLLEHFSAPA